MPKIRSNTLPEIFSLIPSRKEVNAMLRKIMEFLSSRTSDPDRQQQFNGQLLDENREDVYALMQQQMSRLR
jgi:hypothetical protein